MGCGFLLTVFLVLCVGTVRVISSDLFVFVALVGTLKMLVVSFIEHLAPLELLTLAPLTALIILLQALDLITNVPPLVKISGKEN